MHVVLEGVADPAGGVDGLVVGAAPLLVGDAVGHLQGRRAVDRFFGAVGVRVVRGEPRRARRDDCVCGAAAASRGRVGTLRGHVGRLARPGRSAGRARVVPGHVVMEERDGRALDRDDLPAGEAAAPHDPAVLDRACPAAESDAGRDVEVFIGSRTAPRDRPGAQRCARRNTGVTAQRIREAASDRASCSTSSRPNPYQS